MTQTIPISALTKGVNIAAPVGFPTLVSIQVVDGKGGDLCLKITWS